MTEKAAKELTGRKVLIITVSAFAVIIGVNLFMAFQAIDTFPGLEVKNGYVASQTFQADRDAQEALAWDVAVTIDEGILRLDIKGADGAPVTVGSLSGTLGRATHTGDDQTPDFARSSTGAYLAQVGDLAPGNWNLRMQAVALDGTRFHQRIVIHITKG